MKDEFFGIEFAGFPNHFAFGGIKQNVFVAEPEKVRALPHFAGIHRIDGLFSIPFSGSKRVQVLPAAQVLGLVEQELSANFLLARTDAHVPDLSIAPQKRIAKSGKVRTMSRLKN